MIRSTLLVALLASSSLDSPASAQVGVRLNGPLPLGVTGDVFADQERKVTFSSDGAWLVYLADGETDEIRELYALPMAGGAPRKLSETIGSTESIAGYEITADSSRVVYLVRTSNTTLNRLYSVRLDGSEPAVELAPGLTRVYTTRLDPASRFVFFVSEDRLMRVPVDGGAPTLLVEGVAGGTQFHGTTFAPTPDGGRVVYTAYLPGPYAALFSVPSDGGAPPVRLSKPKSGPVSGASGMKQFCLDPTGARVAFTDDGDTARVHELYVSPVDGSTPPVKLNGPLVAEGDVGGPFGSGLPIGFDPTGTRVVYVADQSIDGVNELFSSEVSSAASNVKLSGPLVTGGGVTEFQISASGADVLYRANQVAVDEFGLYRVSIDGAAGPVTLYAGAGESVDRFLLSSDDTSVVCHVGAGGADFLQRIPIAGGAGVRLTPPALIFTSGEVLLPDSSRVLFQGILQPGPYRLQLYCVPLDGTQVVTQLNSPLALSELKSFVVAPDGSLAIYLGDEVRDNQDELFSVPTDGGAPATSLNVPLAMTVLPQGEVTEFGVTPDGSHAVYVADQDTLDSPELYGVSLTGIEPPFKLSGPLIDGGGVYFDFSYGGGGRVLYRAIQDGPHAEIYSVPVDRSTAPIKLNGPMVEGGMVSFPLRVSPDGTRVLYRADQAIDDAMELYSTAVDGSAAPQRLHPPLSATQDVYEWWISAGGTRAVFSANLDDPTTVELYSAPLDGSAPPLKLNPALTPGGDLLLGIRVAAGRVVYAADQDTNNVVELYSVPEDGGGPLFKLNGPLVTNGDVVALAISTAGTVLYVADQETDETLELYSARVDGSNVAVHLNGPLVIGGDVIGTVISRNGQWAVYLADALEDERFELFCVPTDGSSPPVRVSTGSAADVLDGFRITPDGQRVVFLEKLGGVANLFSAPIDGSAPAVRLNPAVPGRQVTGFQIDPPGHVLYTSDHAAIRRFELYRVPVDGSGPGRRINPDFGLLADIAEPTFTPSFRGTPAGDAVLYRADQLDNETVELFVTFLGTDKKKKAGAPGRLVETSEIMDSGSNSRTSVGPFDDGDGHDRISYREDALDSPPSPGEIRSLDVPGSLGSSSLAADGPFRRP